MCDNCLGLAMTVTPVSIGRQVGPRTRVHSIHMHAKFHVTTSFISIGFVQLAKSSLPTSLPHKDQWHEPACRNTATTHSSWHHVHEQW
jgi:hypothetical protein